MRFTVGDVVSSWAPDVCPVCGSTDLHRYVSGGVCMPGYRRSPDVRTYCNRCRADVDFVAGEDVAAVTDGEPQP